MQAPAVHKRARQNDASRWSRFLSRSNRATLQDADASLHLRLLRPRIADAFSQSKLLH